MTLDEYVDGMRRTARGPFSERDHRLLFALGLCGEAGECAEHVKKAVWFGRVLDRDAFEDELGDVLWYLAALADAHGFRLDDIAARNLAKLRARYPDGFKVDREDKERGIR